MNGRWHAFYRHGLPAAAASGALMGLAAVLVALFLFTAGCGQAIKGITLGWYEPAPVAADSTAVVEEVEP